MLKVTMNDKGRVRAIDKDSQPTWIAENTVGGKLPQLPKWMLPVVNIRDEKGYRSLHNDTSDYLISNKLEVIPCSGQYWNELNSRQQGKLLELVEYLGGDADQYVKDFEKMYPNDPEGKRR